MKFAVMGAGGVGGYLGAKLSEAGEDVSFVARGAHLEALRRTGLRIRGVEDLHITGLRATETPAELGTVDVVLFCVKLYDTRAAAEAIAPIVGANTMVLTLQNGIESVDQLKAAVGESAVLAGAAYFPASITGPGEITYFGKIANRPHVIFGEPGGGESARVTALVERFRAAAVVAEASTDTDVMLWEKFLLVVGSSAATGVTRSTVGAVRGDPDMRWLLREAIAEAERVGRAAGVALNADVVDSVMEALDANPADGKASQLVDLEAGRRLELDGLSGTVVRLGREFGVPTPVHATVYAALKPFRDGAPGA